MKTVNELYQAIEARKPRSAWDKGVTAYALDLLCELDEAVRDGYYPEEIAQDSALLKEALLNGARDWSQYSWGGSALIYDEDIAARLCTPSELKKTRNGERKPNAQEEWLDVQARALFQACSMILRSARY